MSILAVRTRLCASLFNVSRVRVSTAIRQCRHGLAHTSGPRRPSHPGTRRKVSDAPGTPGLPRRRTTLHIRGVPLETTPETIPRIFSQFGDIKDSVIIRDSKGNFTGDAFVEYYLPDHATRALSAYNQEGIMVNGRPVELVYYKRSLTTVKPSRTLHIAEMPKDVTLFDITSAFKEFSLAYNVRLGRYAGSAYVDFPSAELGQRVMERHQDEPFTMRGRKLTLYYAQPTFTPPELDRKERPVPTRKHSNPPASTVFVTKFAKPMLERDIRGAFKQFGEIQSVILNYYEDRPSRTMAFIKYRNTEAAARAIEAWKLGNLRFLGENLRMDFETDPTLHNQPYHTLRLSGYTSGLDVLESIAKEFKQSVWRYSEPAVEQGRKGKATSVGYIEFITVDHATAAREALHGRVINGDERMTAAFAKPLKAWTLHGGVGKRDHGGEHFSYGTIAEGKGRDSGAPLFHSLERKEQWSKLQRISTYLGNDWKAGNEDQVKELLKTLVRRRAEKAAVSDHALRALEASIAQAKQKPGDGEDETSST